MPNNKLKVVVSGLLYPMTMLHWFWRALERREDVDLFVTGPFFDNFIPWNYGMRLPQKYVKVPNLPLPSAMARGRINSKVVESVLPWSTPDLWLQIDADWHFSNKPKAKVVAHIQTDPHVLRPGYKEVRQYSDIVFCMQECYKEESEVYLPYAYDPVIYYPQNVEKKYDACLIGLLYPQRMQLIHAIESLGFNVFYDVGKIYDENREIYNSSKVALSWSSLKDTPARVWEAMGMGLPLLANRTPDMKNFFVDGEDYFGFDTVEEAAQEFLVMMSDYDHAKKVGMNAHEKVKGKHTWDNRIQFILNECGYGTSISET